VTREAGKIPARKSGIVSRLARIEFSSNRPAAKATDRSTSSVWEIPSTGPAAIIKRSNRAIRTWRMFLLDKIFQI
jgi:hypothetical protein